MPYLISLGWASIWGSGQVAQFTETRSTSCCQTASDEGKPILR